MDLSVFVKSLVASLAPLDDAHLHAQIQQAAASIARAEHIWCTGFGKSARAASLLAADLSTLTLPASFVHGGDLLHGGMGPINDRHCVVLFSDRGKNREMAQTSGVVRATRILVTASASPGIEADHIVHYASQPDGPYPLPTATVAQVIVGRMLAFAAAELAQILPLALRWAHPA